MSEMHERFVAYINERAAIRTRRLLGEPRPWTKDPILQTYKFCNVRRDWDWTTQWLRHEWYAPHLASSYMGVAASLARFIGYVPTLERIGFPAQNWVLHVHQVLTESLQRGEKTYTGAYMLKSDARPKPVYTVEMVLAPVQAGVWREPWDSAFALHRELVQLNGWGGFMAQEVVLDLIGSWVLAKAQDIKQFAFAGPGAMRGLNRIYGRDLTFRYPQRWTGPDPAWTEMFELWRRVTNAQSGLQHALRRCFTLHDVEFNLCEFDKYERVRLEQGRPRSKFTPTHELVP